jgi:hypothetical protein
MRRVGLVPLAALGVVLAVAGCANPRQAKSSSGVATPAQHRVPAPKNPDLTEFMERFYQQVTSGRWPFAYAMLSPRLRAALTQQQLVERYQGIVDPNVRARQLSDRTVVAWLDGTERAHPGHPLHVRETVTLAWDGEQWTIDAIERRSVSPNGTR